MKTSNLFLGAALAGGMAAGACDNSKADLDRTKADLATVTTERDSLKSQLDTSKAHEAALTKEVGDMNAKTMTAAAAAQPAKSVKPKAPEHAMATPQKKEQKPSKKSSSKG